MTETTSSAMPISLEDRVFEMQLDLRHLRQKIDLIAFFLQKIEKEGLKVKVVK
jgi:hypothetical protein